MRKLLASIGVLLLGLTLVACDLETSKKPQVIDPEIEDNENDVEGEDEGGVVEDKEDENEDIDTDEEVVINKPTKEQAEEMQALKKLLNAKLQDYVELEDYDTAILTKGWKFEISLDEVNSLEEAETLIVEVKDYIVGLIIVLEN